MRLILTIDDFHYLRISLVNWRINGTSRIKNLDVSTADTVLNQIKALVDHKAIVLDFKGIVSITDGALNSCFTEWITAKREIHFINCTAIKPGLRNLFDEFGSSKKILLTDHADTMVLHPGEVIRLKGTYVELWQRITDYINNEIVELIRDSFLPHNETSEEFKPLISTPILSTGTYDASYIISDPNSFSWVCIRMADLVEEIISKNALLNCQLLSVSLRASPFANAVSLLLGLQMRTVDHLGPFNKVWDIRAFHQFNIPNTNYIFIGDFMVGGTELKLAHLLANYCASELKFAVVLGNVLSPARFAGYEIISICDLTLVHPKCKYKL